MTKRTWLLTLAGVLLAGVMHLIDSPVAQTAPLIPPTPAEIEYLDQLRRVLPGTGDPVAFNNDAELLAKGRYVCYMRDANELVGYEATLVSAAVAQLAFIYLCPN
ncbi:hypothetical protein [Mycolicibacterium holsaticum]|uniref:DUF732 domain-containing protein n=1 Tax=Mycolicibacterium holsaticum TaxID=152142 RepID=A0A1E3RU54_9MYCO|nr:hypothetical protein [Mycolicibacterium holsaticum]ODQ93394.1 hypothetical protein BHQ17_13595 [Mycolicibacterium holsaticum]